VGLMGCSRLAGDLLTVRMPPIKMVVGVLGIEPSPGSDLERPSL